LYAFADAGVIDYGDAINNTWISDLRADAGLGSALTIKKWGPLDLVKPLTIRFDMPFFLNRPPAIEEYFQFRWILSISRAF
jgi:aminopeptidase N